MMAFVTGRKGSFTVKAYVGDNKTLLAFNFDSASDAKNLAGFTIECQPHGKNAYYLYNELQFEQPDEHAQVKTEIPNSTVNAPIQKFRWVHVPGTNHQGINPLVGDYTYTVTPRYFDSDQRMLPLDGKLSASIKVPVGPFRSKALSVGFTRGYMQSEAFAHHFGATTPIEPADKPLQFDTSKHVGMSGGHPFTYADMYAWMGSSSRILIFSLLDEVLKDKSLHLDVMAYDLNEPDFVKILLELAEQKRVSVILDNSSEHHNAANSKLEDQFTTLFDEKAVAPAAIQRGCFDRYAHDKILIVSKHGSPVKVLTGSTNFSVTGLYVNANHVAVFDDTTVAKKYADVFQKSWNILKEYATTSAKASAAFAATPDSEHPFEYKSATVPKMNVTFAPHTSATADTILRAIAERAKAEESAEKGSVLFAVMQLTGSETPVYNALNLIHQSETVFSYGISDSPDGTYLHASGSKTGVLVTGKPSAVTLPAPFDKLHSVSGHEIHDKFVVCGLNGSDPVVWFGSSNLATGGEKANGDNLVEMHDADVATAFAIEALLLVDHYAFLDRYAAPKKPKAAATKAHAAHH